jgi:phosphoglycolate phosphatase
VNALLTGNLERGARIKLAAAGLWHHFQFGVWGDEGSRRVDLGPLALERARHVTGLTFSPSETVVVGDSLHDVECGLALGARVVAVATGKTSAEELANAGADRVFKDFSDLEEATRALLG